MFISIIIPVYNVEQYLRECLDSVVSQSFDDYEVVCINDGSSDGSLAILEEYKNRYSKIQVISQQNKGLSGARNVGIKAAKGDYVFFLDSDDWVEPNTLQILFENNSGQDLLCFNGRSYYENGFKEEPDKGITEDKLKGWDYYCKYALVSRKFHFVCTVLRMYRNEFLIQNNLFFEEGIYHEDNLFTPIACYKAEFVKVIPDCLYIYRRMREGSITEPTNGQKANYKRIIDTVYVSNKLSYYFIPKIGIDKLTLYREIAGGYFKPFTPGIISQYGNRDADIIKLINWTSFKSVSLYPRHKIFYRLLKIHPIAFRLYFSIEEIVKSLKRRK